MGSENSKEGISGTHQANRSNGYPSHQQQQQAAVSHWFYCLWSSFHLFILVCSQ